MRKEDKWLIIAAVALLGLLCGVFYSLVLAETDACERFFPEVPTFTCVMSGKFRVTQPAEPQVWEDETETEE